ncbi:MAG: phytanoyl-CoA dioxygenase family protein [Planctomycetota bacterium]|nr:phytanoyl-CoA dioxygenase family protein [Planctomycetota bacterium]
MILQDQVKPAELKYRHEFKPGEHEATMDCVNQRGFAVIKGMISRAFVDELVGAIREALNPDNDLGPGESRVGHAFMERCPTLLKFLDHKPWLDFISHSEGSADLRFHRSAAIIRNPGSPPVAWHSDWSFRSGLHKLPPRSIDDVLNVHEGLGGRWFYLTGTHPMRGGLAVIEGSNKIDWPGPEGFEFGNERRFIYKKGAEPKAHTGWDVPGIVPFFTDPGDMILFASRTYHYAFSNLGDQPRYSCGGPGLRARSKPNFCPWPLPESSKRFIASLPERHRRFAEGYGGFDSTWKFDASQVEADAMR